MSVPSLFLKIFFTTPNLEQTRNVSDHFTLQGFNEITLGLGADEQAELVSHCSYQQA